MRKGKTLLYTKEEAQKKAHGWGLSTRFVGESTDVRLTGRKVTNQKIELQRLEQKINVIKRRIMFEEGENVFNDNIDSYSWNSLCDLDTIKR